MFSLDLKLDHCVHLSRWIDARTHWLNDHTRFACFTGCVFPSETPFDFHFRIWTRNNLKNSFVLYRLVRHSFPDITQDGLITNEFKTLHNAILYSEAQNLWCMCMSQEMSQWVREICHLVAGICKYMLNYYFYLSTRVGVRASLRPCPKHRYF